MDTAGGGKEKPSSPSSRSQTSPEQPCTWSQGRGSPESPSSAHDVFESPVAKNGSPGLHRARRTSQRRPSPSEASPVSPEHSPVAIAEPEARALLFLCRELGDEPITVHRHLDQRPGSPGTVSAALCH